MREGQLPHAMLFSGPAGVGKLDFARQLAQSLLCEQAADDGQPCGNCRGCQLFAAGTHPDFFLLQPEEDGKEITVGQVRELVAYQSFTPQYGRAKVVVIEPAERMNLNAANALLKTLEEPGRDTILILVTGRTAALLPTIRSRCQQLLFRADFGEAAQQWLGAAPEQEAQARLALAVAAGAPLRARALLNDGGLQRRQEWFAEFQAVADGKLDPVALAAGWQALPLAELLPALYGWFADMVQIKMSATTNRLSNPDLRSGLQAMAERVDLRQLFGHLDKVQETTRLLRGQLNGQLLLEELLLGWAGQRR